MYSLYRGKSLLTNEWVYGYLTKNFNTQQIYINTPNEYIPVDDTTVGLCIGWSDSTGTNIYTGDIVQFGDYTTELIWFCNEMQCMEAVKIDSGEPYCIGDGRGNELDYHNFEYTQNDYSEFCTMLQDPYRDFQNKTCVQGNVFDNPELLKHVKNLSKCKEVFAQDEN